MSKKSADPNNTRSNTVQQTIRESETRKRNVQHRQQKRLIKRKGRETSPSLNQNGSLTQSDK